MEINDQGTIYMAKVLIEMGNIASESERRLHHRIAEVGFQEDQIKETEKSHRNLRVRYDELHMGAEELKSTIASLKLEREHFTEQNLRLHNELMKWRFAYPKRAKKFREKSKLYTEGCSNIPGPKVDGCKPFVGVHIHKGN